MFSLVACEFTISVNQNKIESKLNNVEMSKENKPYFSRGAIGMAASKHVRKRLKVYV